MHTTYQSRPPFAVSILLAALSGLTGVGCGGGDDADGPGTASNQDGGAQEPGGDGDSGGGSGSSEGTDGENGGNGGESSADGSGGDTGASGGNGSGGGEPVVDPRANPIEVPAELVPVVADPGTGPVCSDVDLSSVPPGPNPGYQDETLDDEVLSGEDIWETSFYMMLFANCERQARGLDPFFMYSPEKMLEMQLTYILQGGHDNFGERADIAGGGAAEGAGGAPFIGATMGAMGLNGGEDNNDNGLWDPHEAGRRPGTGLVDHGNAMVDPDNHCVWASVTIGPTADNYMNAVVFYGTKCDAAE